MPDQIPKISGDGVKKNKYKKKPINPALKKLISDAELKLEMLKIQGAIRDLGYGLEWFPERSDFITYAYRKIVLGQLFSAATGSILNLAEFIVVKEFGMLSEEVLSEDCFNKIPACIKQEIVSTSKHRCGQLKTEDAREIIGGWGFKLPSPTPFHVWRKSHVYEPPPTDRDPKFSKYVKAKLAYGEYTEKFKNEHPLVKAIICVHAFKGFSNYVVRDDYQLQLQWQL